MRQIHKANIRVVVIDASIPARNLLVTILTDAGMSVVATGHDGIDAVRLVKEFHPDVIAMDIRMPKMDGLEATRRIMREHPTPIVIVTGSQESQDRELAFQAMRAGALTMVNKPEISNPQACEEIVQAVRVMSDVRVIHHWGSHHQDVPKRAPADQDERLSRVVDISRHREIKVIGIASSTGGPSALSAVLGDLPADYPLPILAVQHVSPGFTSGLAEWLRTVIKIRVDVAAHGDKFKPGAVVFAPDDYHLQANSRGETELSLAPAYKGLRPSANLLFESLAQHYGKKSVGIVLTGMGDDGADGLEMLHQAGGLTIGQDKQSCVVYGMPREAAVRNAVDAQMNLEEIASFLRRIGEAKKNASKMEAGAL